MRKWLCRNRFNPDSWWGRWQQLNPGDGERRRSLAGHLASPFIDHRLGVWARRMRQVRLQRPLLADADGAARIEGELELGLGVEIRIVDLDLDGKQHFAGIADAVDA